MCGTCRELLNEAMNLAVRSEQFEEQLRREAALGISQDAERWQAGGMFEAYVEGHNAEYLWVQDQYNKDLASWRERTAAHLTQCNESG